MSFIDTVKNWAQNSIVDEIILFAIFLSIMETIAQNMLKSNTELYTLQFVIGIIVYIMIGYILHYAYYKFPLGKLNVIWSCVTIVLAIILGYILYEEPINKWSILAVLFALMAIYFIYKSDQEIESEVV